jgi:type I restriction enzyme, R subunit
MRSLNFEFLKTHEPLLAQLGAAAERYCFEDPNVSLYKLRQFGELLAQMTAGSVGLSVPRDANQMTLLRDLESRGAIRGDVQRLFHEIRKTGNDAVHSLVGNQRVALEHLRYACFLGIWFHRSLGGAKDFKAAFIPPKLAVEPAVSLESTLLQKEIRRLNAELAEQVSAAELAEADRLRQAQQLEVLAKSIEQSEAEKQQIQAKLTALETQAQAIPAPKLQSLVNRAADTLIDLDEAATRRLIDQQLRDAGWDADSEMLDYSQGTRPEKGRNLAIAEYPIGRRFADYVLFIGLQAVAVIEAKRQYKNVQSGALDQAISRYATKFPGGLPFAFATNGRPLQQQIKALSGIWFQDLRQETNQSRAIGAWFKPEDLQAMLQQDIAAADQQLTQTAFEASLALYDYQKAAIQAVETAIIEQKLAVLLAMATGTGKTRTAIALCYRFLQTNRFRRILFLVDRSVLGKQTSDAFVETAVSPTLRFSDVFGVKGLKEILPEVDTRVQIATIQGMVKRVLFADDQDKPSAGQYDCIIVDECHRGYTLDREMSDAELAFRDFNDYVSKYRQVLDYFDAVRIGLTATPAPHTANIFGQPIFYYGYNQAVIDRKLVPHEPPIEIHTKLAQEGITWNAGETIEAIDVATNQSDLFQLDDEVSVEIEQFNRKVIVPEFNRVICETLANKIDFSAEGKTLVFCVNDLHADEVVGHLKAAFSQYYSVHRDAIKKITGSADDPQGWTKQFKNEQYPKIAVTVDLLTTGVDVPKIVNLVFLRRVNSRILYDQMKGRATRLCPEIGKEAFTIYDAVGVCRIMDQYSDMKATVVQPKTSFAQLTNYILDCDLSQAKLTEIAHVKQSIDQWLAKFQRQQARWSESRTTEFATLAGIPADQMLQFVRSQVQSANDRDGLRAVQTWLGERQNLINLLDQKDDPASRRVWLAPHEDQVVRVERYFQAAENGADYLEQFAAFLRDQNQVAALNIVTQRPKELTRSQLKEVRELLSQANFDEKSLEVAWRERTNQDMAASIIGFIRQAAIGDALIPWTERVDRAMQGIYASRDWTMPQRKWLERIAQQLKVELVVDRAALDQGFFRHDMGGFQRGDKVFEGKLAGVLAEISDRLWDGA